MFVYFYAVAFCEPGLESAPQSIAYQGTSFDKTVSAPAPEILTHGSVIVKRAAPPFTGIGFQPWIGLALVAHVVSSVRLCALFSPTSNQKAVQGHLYISALPPMVA